MFPHLTLVSNLLLVHSLAPPGVTGGTLPQTVLAKHTVVQQERVPIGDSLRLRLRRRVWLSHTAAGRQLRGSRYSPSLGRRRQAWVEQGVAGR